MRQVLAVILVVLTAAPTLPGQTGSKERVLAIPAGSTVEVRLKDKTRLSGRLGAVSDAGFELQTERSGKIETRQIGFDDLQSIKDTSKRPHPVRRTVVPAIVGGVAVAALVVALVVVGALASAGKGVKGY